MNRKEVIERVEAQTAQLGQVIRAAIADDTHFALLLFSTGSPEMFRSYSTDMSRAGLVKVLREYADILEKGLDAPPGVLAKPN